MNKFKIGDNVIIKSNVGIGLSKEGQWLMANNISCKIEKVLKADYYMIKASIYNEYDECIYQTVMESQLDFEEKSTTNPCQGHSVESEKEEVEYNEEQANKDFLEANADQTPDSIKEEYQNIFNTNYLKKSVEELGTKGYEGTMQTPPPRDFDPIIEKEVTKHDSGKPREFESGAMRDSDIGKEDYVESISWLALQRYARYMKTQEEKYPPGNWRKGIPVKEYEKSLMRHLQKYLANKYDGANLEPEIDHLGAATFNLLGLMHELEKSNTK